MSPLSKISTIYLVIFSVTTCSAPREYSLVIAAAANLQFAIEDIVNVFEKTSNIRCNLVVGSSGQLTTQLTEGAPYDIFLSADLKYPNTLHDKDLTDGAPVIYAYGQLVLWSMVTKPPSSLRDLESDKFEHLAIANPLNAPYGAAAIESMKYSGVYEALKPKLVFGESISQTNHFILSQSAEIGFTAKSVVLSPRMIDKGHWQDVDPASYQPIAQGAVVMNGSKHLELAHEFLKFLFSDEAKAILKRYGYLVPENE